MTGSLRSGPLAILAGPCAWSRSACSRVRTSTGWRRWSRSRSPSAGGGPGSGSASPVGTRWSGSGAAVPRREWPGDVERMVEWIRRLRVDHGEGRGGVAVHRSSDPGHWIVTFPWTGAERAHSIAEAAVALTERDMAPTGEPATPSRPRGRSPAGTQRIADARTTPPAWIRDADRKMPVVSITGTNGKSTVTRLTTHILVRAKRRGRDDDVRRRARQRAHGRPRRLDRPRRRVADPRPVRPRRRRPRDGPRRTGPAWHGLRVERGQRRHQRHLRSSRSPGNPHAAGAGRGQVDGRPGHEAGRLVRAQRATIRTSPGSRAGSAGRWRSSRSSPAGRQRSGATRRPAGGATPWTASGWWSSTGRRSTRIVEVRRGPDHDRRAGPAQRRERHGRRCRGPRARAVDRGGRRRARRLPAVASWRRAGSTCSGSGRGSSSSTSPTTRPGSRRCSTSPRASPAAPPVGRRRSPRSSGPPATGRTTRSVASPGSRRSGRSGSRSRRRSSTSAAGPEAVVGEMLAGVKAAGGSWRTCRSTSPRPRPCAASWRTATAGRRGHRPDVPRGARGGLRAAREARRRSRSTSRTS